LDARLASRLLLSEHGFANRNAIALYQDNVARSQLQSFKIGWIEPNKASANITAWRFGYTQFKL